MATVTGLTAARMKAIEAASVVKGAVVGDNLILEKFDASKIDAGNVRGPVGPVGPASDVAGMRRGLFSAYRTSNFSVPVSSWTIIPMEAEAFDLSGWHGSSGFNPKLAGYYRLTVSLYIIGPNLIAGTRLIMAIYKNGAYLYELVRTREEGANDHTVTGSVIVQANGTTDYFQPGFNHSNNVAVDIEGSGSRTYFQGELIAPTA